MNSENNDTNIENKTLADIVVKSPVETPQMDSGMNLITSDQQTQPLEISKHDTSGAVANTEAVVHDFESQFERYIKIGNFTYSSDSPLIPDKLANWSNPIQPLASYQFPQALFDSSGFVKCRLGHWAYIKADIQVQIKMNANQFQLGAILITYVPADKLVADYLAKSILSMQGMSSSPTSMVLHCDGGTTGVMTIPYASIVDAFSLNDADNQFGTLFIYPLVNLAGPTNSEKAAGTVFARFVKPDWQVPSHFEYTSTPVSSLTRYEKDDIQSVLGKYGLRMADVTIDSNEIFAEAGDSEEGAHHGPISTLANKVATVGGALSQVPLIGNIAGLASTIASGVGAVSSALGFSKPHNDVTPEFVVNTPGIGVTNGLGKDNSHTLAMVPGNSIDASKSTASKHDEMSIDYIKQFPTIVDRIDISKDSWSANSLLYTIPITPAYSRHTGSGIASLGIWQYVCTLFKYWRGTINVDINIIRTRYHNGRFVVVYLPLTTTAPPTLDDKITTCYSKMFDLEKGDCRPDGCHFTFSVPYMSNRPWHNVLTKSSMFDYDDSTMHGCIGVYALTDLIVPTTVYQGVKVLTAIWGGDDFELSYPATQVAVGTKDSSAITQKELLTAEFRAMFTAPSNFPRRFSMIFGSTFSSNTLSVWGFSADDSQGESVTVFYNNAPGTNFYQTTYTSNVAEQTSGDNIHFSVWMPDNHNVAFNVTFRPFVQNGFIAFHNLDSDGNNADLFKALAGWSDGDPIYFQYIGMNSPQPTETVHPNPEEIFAEISAPEPEILVPNVKSTDARSSTVGEFVKSLRFYIKRPSRVGIIRQGNVGAYTPFLCTFDGSGARSTSRVNITRNIKESQLSLASYIYRFYCGGFRTKIFMTNPTAMVHTGLVQGSTSDISDSVSEPNPSYAQLATVNNVAETTVPYYSAFRSRILNANKLEDTTKQWIFSSKNAQFWEAASEDTTFHFLVPPPIIHKALLSTTHMNNPMW